MKSKAIFIILIVLGVFLVAIICGSMGYMMHRHRRGAMLFKEGEQAFLKGDYEAAESALSAYVKRDRDKEEAWKYLALIKESRNEWFEAAQIWRRLVGLNVLNDEYLSKCIQTNYMVHNYSALGDIFENFAEKRRENYLEIYALTRFKLHPKDTETDELIERLPAESNVKRLIMAMKNLGPASELEALKNVDDHIIQVEACVLDASIAEVREKNLERAEQNLRRAVEINPTLCLAELGDFFFRNKRYDEALEAYSNSQTLILNKNTNINYAEILFYKNQLEDLQKLEKKMPSGDSYSIAIRAYIQSMMAFLSKDTEGMVRNYDVAQIKRDTPMCLLLSYAVAVEKNDIPLLTDVLYRWIRTTIFTEKKDAILADVRKVLTKGIADRNYQETARLARLFLGVKPPELVAWHAVLFEQAARNKISDKLLEHAIELFPDDPTIRSLALRAAYAKGDNEGIIKAYEESIAKSKTPFQERYRKALYFERRGDNDNAFTEIKRILEEDNTLEEAKHCLAFGMRSGSKEALEFAAKLFPELADIAKFELDRRYGDGVIATKLLKEKELEKGLDAEKIADREILLPLAIYLGLVGEPKRAVAALEALKPYTQSSATVELNLSENYAMMGNKELAMSTIESVYSRFTDSVIVKAVYGLRCAENNDFQKAVTLISDSATEPRFRATLVLSLEKSIENCFNDKRYVTCRAYATRLSALQPENKCAKEFLQKLDEIQQQEEEAEKQEQ